jgi:acid stress-induced BolA-like protein IbaG/YrbA
MISAEYIESLILQVLPGAKVRVQDPMNDGQHFAAEVVAEQFTGLTMIKQHRLVNEALKEYLDSGAIHAMQLKTYTVEQWQQNMQSNVEFG